MQASLSQTRRLKIHKIFLTFAKLRGKTETGDSLC